MNLLSAETRTRIARNHAMIALDGHVKAPLPGWKCADGVVLISPRLGAEFSEYLALLSSGAVSAAPKNNVSRFVFVLSGEVSLAIGDDVHPLGVYGYALIPANTPHSIASSGVSRLVVIEKPYEPLANHTPPVVVVGHEAAVPATPMLGDDAVHVRLLLPDDLGLDLAVNTMTFQPGAVLPFVETHVMEHGLMMLEGQGIYRLDDAWYPVHAGDVIYMAPYCPQWFVAMGKTQAKYLIYKDWNRDPK
jgi:(S)-ureidoglycine aminohydrolase